MSQQTWEQRCFNPAGHTLSVPSLMEIPCSRKIQSITNRQRKTLFWCWMGTSAYQRPCHSARWWMPCLAARTASRGWRGLSLLPCRWLSAAGWRQTRASSDPSIICRRCASRQQVSLHRGDDVVSGGTRAEAEQGWQSCRLAPEKHHQHLCSERCSSKSQQE